MRPIDADAFRRDGLRFQDGINESGVLYVRYSDVLKSLTDAPTLDVAPVVRCRDCRWACLAPQRQTATCMKNRLPFTHKYDWFCADGEWEYAGDEPIK